MATQPEASSADEFLQDHQWISAWKRPPSAAAPASRSGDPGFSKLRPQYDSAIEAYSTGLGKGSRGAKVASPTSGTATTDANGDDEAQDSVTAPPIRHVSAQRTASERLLATNIQEPQPREGSALRYGHQNDVVMTREQYQACQRKNMAGRPPADAFYEDGSSLFTSLFIMGWVWIVYPGSFVKSLVFLMRDVTCATACAMWCHLPGQSRRRQGLRQQEQRRRPTEYEVIPASKYLEVAMARRAAAARLADLQPIRE